MLYKEKLNCRNVRISNVIDFFPHFFSFLFFLRIVTFKVKEFPLWEIRGVVLLFFCNLNFFLYIFRFDGSKSSELSGFLLFFESRPGHVT